MIVRFWLVLGFFLAVKASAKVVVACVDCYSSAALYAESAARYGLDVEWVLIQTHEYWPSHQATLRAFPAGSDRRSVDPQDPEAMESLVRELKGKNVQRVLGGMDEGMFHAAYLADRLGLPGNPLPSRHLKVNKYDQANVLGEFGIPSHLLSDVKAGVDFIQSLDQEELVLKFNRGAGGFGLELHRRTNPEQMKEWLQRRLKENLGTWGLPDSVVIQPWVEGPEYFAQGFTWKGRTHLTGLFRYFKIRFGGHHLYFLDIPLNLDGAEASEIKGLFDPIMERVDFRQGPSHLEFIKGKNGKFRLVDGNFRTAGGGIPVLERALWGVSNLDLYVLSQLDEAKLEEELARLSLTLRSDGMVLVVPAPVPGTLSMDAVEAVKRLPSYLPVGEGFEPSGGKVFEKATHDLKSSAFMVFFAGPTRVVQQDVDTVLEWLTNHKLILPSRELGADEKRACEELFTAMAEQRSQIVSKSSSMTQGSVLPLKQRPHEL